MRSRVVIFVIIIFIMSINIQFKNIDAGRSNEINTNETWDTDKIILENLTINAMVTIEPGVTVYLGENVDLKVKGGLKAVGTENKRITFTKYGEASWGHIILKSSGIFEYCDIEGTKGIADYTGIYIRHSKIDSDGYGIAPFHSDMINNTIIARNGDALNYYYDPLGNWDYISRHSPHKWVNDYYFTIANNTISAKNGYGIQIPKAYVYNNYIIDVSQDGINTKGIIKNNVIINSTIGILSDGVIENNSIENSHVGISGMEVKMIANNSIQNCSSGISVSAYEFNNYIYNNNIQYNERGIAFGGNGIVSNNIIENNNIGIKIDNSPSAYMEDGKFKDLIITNNSIKNNTEYGIYMEGSFPKIKNNNISYNGNGEKFHGGIYIRSSYGNQRHIIENNIISFNKNFGISFGYHSIGIVKNNLIINNGKYGISCNETLNIKIDGNIILNNNKFGIYINKRSFPIITNNLITDNNQYGIYTKYKSWPTIENNEISGHKIGIYIDSTSNATVLENEFYDNEKNIVDKYHKKDDDGSNPLYAIENQIVIILMLIIIVGIITWAYRRKKLCKQN